MHLRTSRARQHLALHVVVVTQRAANMSLHSHLLGARELSNKHHVLISCFRKWLQGFTDAHKFDPDRFSPARQEDLKFGKHFLTFGFGPHSCVGREYAINHLVPHLNPPTLSDRPMMFCCYLFACSCMLPDCRLTKCTFDCFSSIGVPWSVFWCYA